MPGSAYLLTALGVVLVVTVSLRALPFVLIGPLRDSHLIRFLGVHMPGGVMVVLVAYTLREVPIRSWPYGLPEVLSIAVTAGLHLWRGNAVVSIVAGTASYIALTSWVLT